MAYYKDAPHQRRKVNHADQGSWDDEGTHYHHKPAGTREPLWPGAGQARARQPRQRPPGVPGWPGIPGRWKPSGAPRVLPPG